MADDNDQPEDDDAIRRRIRAASNAADMAAVTVVRLAATETPDNPLNPNLKHEDIEHILDHLEETHGDYAITALTAALARWAALAFGYWAQDQNRTLAEFIDEWEMRLLAVNLDDDPGQDGAD